MQLQIEQVGYYQLHFNYLKNPIEPFAGMSLDTI